MATSALLLGILALVVPWNLGMGEIAVVSDNGGTIARIVVIVGLAVCGIAIWVLSWLACFTRLPRVSLGALAVVATGFATMTVGGVAARDHSRDLGLMAFPSADSGITRLPGWALPTVIASVLVACVGLVVRWSRVSSHPGALGLATSAPVWCALAIWIGLPRTGGPVQERFVANEDLFAILRFEASPASAAAGALIFASVLGLVGTFRILAMLGAVEVGDAHVRLGRAVAAVVPSGRRILLGIVAVKVVVLALGLSGLLFRDAPAWRSTHWSAWVAALPFTAFAALALFSTRDRRIAPRHHRLVLGLLVGLLAVPSLYLLAAGLADVALAALDPWRSEEWRTGFPWTISAGERLPQMARFSFLVALLAAGSVGAMAFRRSGVGSPAIIGLGAALWGLPVATQNAFGFESPALLSALVLDVFATGVVGVLAFRRSLAEATRRRLLMILLTSSLLVFTADVLLPGELLNKIFVFVLVLPVLWRFFVDTEDDASRPAARAVVSMTLWALLLVISAVGLAANTSKSEFAGNGRLGWQLVLVPVILLWLCAEPLRPPDEEPASGWRGGTSIRGHRRQEPRADRYMGLFLALILVCAAISRQVSWAQQDTPPVRPEYRVGVATPDPFSWEGQNCLPLPKGDSSSPDGEIIKLHLLDSLRAEPQPDTFLYAGHGSTEALDRLLSSEDCVDVATARRLPSFEPDCLGDAVNDRVGGVRVARLVADGYWIVCGWDRRGVVERFVIAYRPVDSAEEVREEMDWMLERLEFPVVAPG